MILIFLSIFSKHLFSSLYKRFFRCAGAAGADGTSYSSSISEIITNSYPNNVTTTKYFTLADLSTNPVITKQTLLFKWNKNNSNGTFKEIHGEIMLVTITKQLVNIIITLKNFY